MRNEGVKNIKKDIWGYVNNQGGPIHNQIKKSYKT